MRTIRDISILMAAVLICGCSKSDENLKLPETQLTITAGFAENDDTKTTLQGTDVYWEVGDEIKVFYGSGSGRFASVNTEETASTTFTGNINVAIGGNEGFTGGEYMWGLYPYRSDATYDGTAVTTTIPEQQTGKAGSFAKNMNISLAKSSNLALAFYNVCGGVRFSVTRNNITDVVFEGRNNEDLAGTIQVAFSEGGPVIQSLTNGQKKITLKAPNSETFESGKWYYIVAVPGTLTNGFKLTFNTATQYAELEKTSSVTVKRAIFGSVEDADEGLVFVDKTQMAVVFDLTVDNFNNFYDGQKNYTKVEDMNIVIYNDIKMSKSEFHQNYPYFEDIPETSQLGTANDEFEKGNESTHVISWTLSADEIWNNPNTDITNKVRYYNDNGESVYVTLHSHIDDITKVFPVAGYVDNYWDAQKTNTYFNVSVPLRDTERTVGLTTQRFYRLDT